MLSTVADERELEKASLVQLLKETKNNPPVAQENDIQEKPIHFKTAFKSFEMNESVHKNLLECIETQKEELYALKSFNDATGSLCRLKRVCEDHLTATQLVLHMPKREQWSLYHSTLIKSLRHFFVAFAGIYMVHSYNIQ